MPRIPLLAALAAGLLTTAAYAQNPDVPLKNRDTDPALPPASQTPPDRVRPSADAPPQDQSLSDKLRKDDGVIKPPADGATGTVVKPDAGTGSMPVIKPGDLPGPPARHRGEIGGAAGDAARPRGRLA